MKAAAIIVLLCVSLVAADNVTWDVSCSKNAQITVTNVVMNPYPASAGADATVTVTGTTKVPITGGKVQTDIYVLGIKVKSIKDDLCPLIGNKCPTPAGGAVTGVKLFDSTTISKSTPPGTYKARMTMSDSNGNELVCLNVTFKLVK
eukprot:GILK01000257.1.p2 GENE.GILK01000257.1~~GILK01000257.1.p2  ORF type:complete len:170 (-),score=37.83 GILK01000257.1:123-563(-)